MEQLNYFTELSQVALPHALKGQKPLAQGNALGIVAVSLSSMITQGAALGKELLPFQGVWSLYAKLELYLITSARMAGGIGSRISSCCNRRRSCP